ncbi:unnamed protein product, partial [Linum tenue]
PLPLFEPGELTFWSFYKVGIAEFIATFLFLYISCSTVGIQGIDWAFKGMIFALIYCSAGISGPPKSNFKLSLKISLRNSIGLTRFLF